MAGVVPDIPVFQFLSPAGAPLANGTVTTYVSGGSTPSTTWQDKAMSSANQNPTTLDARGECLMWLDPAVNYRFLVKNAAGATVWDQPNIAGSLSAIEVNALFATLAGSGGSALVGFIQAGTGAVATTMETKARQIVSVFDYLTDAQKADVRARTALLDVGPAIQVAIDYLDSIGGGTLLFPSGIYRTNQSIAQKRYVSLWGVGSRTAVIRWGAATSAGLVKGVVYSVHGTDGAPELVFSTGLRGLMIDGNDVATVAYACRGWQENCVASDVALYKFTSVGLDIMPFAATNHLATFEDIHSVPAVGATTAVAVRGSDCVSLTFRNITSAAQLDGTSYMAKGIYLFSNPVNNVFINCHAENAVIGLDIDGGANNPVISLTGFCNQVAGNIVYRTTAARHDILSARCIGGYTKLYEGPNASIAGGVNVDSGRVNSAGTGFQRDADTVTEDYTIASRKLRGVSSYIGLSGDGETELRINDFIAASTTRYIVLNLGGSNVGFSGTVKVRGVGSVRHSSIAQFGAIANADGTVSNSTVSAVVSNIAGAVTIAAPVALAVATANFVRIGITEGAAFDQSVEYSVEISVAGRQAVAITASS
jgi:hypothetical protein